MNSVVSFILMKFSHEIFLFGIMEYQKTYYQSHREEILEKQILQQQSLRNPCTKGLNIDHLISQLHGRHNIKHIGRFTNLFFIQQVKMIEACAADQDE